ncbi:MAG: flagellar filament capping protein FliD [Acidobacteriota bacterium]
MSSVSAVNSLLGSPTSSVNISSILAASTGASSTGIDVTSAVASAIAAARAPENNWNAEKTTLSSQTTALTSIQSATQAIATDLQLLNTLTGPLSARTVTSSNPNVLSATAASGTVSGTHTIVVNTLATTGAWYTDLESSPTSAIPATKFTITNAAGQTSSITTGSGVNNLTQLAAAINSATDSSGKTLGLTATVVSDSTGSRLAIISNTSGSGGDFSISSTDYSGTSWTSPDIGSGQTLGANTVAITVAGKTTNVATTSGETYAQLATAINALGLGVTATAGSDSNGTHLNIASTDGTTPFTINEPSFGFSQAVVGANANLTVDGVPVSSATNTVTGAISGVTLNLLGSSAGSPINLTVAADATQASTAITKLVNDYNTAIGLVNAQFQFNGSTNSEGVLASDPTLRALQSSLEQALNFVSTPATGTTTTPTLSSMGISVGQDGILSIDTAAFSKALTSNPGDVQNFFEGASLNGFAATMNNALNTFLAPANGAFTVDLRSISATISSLTDEINNFEANYITPMQTRLTAEFSKAEIALQQLPAQMAQINAELGLNSNGK